MKNPAYCLFYRPFFIFHPPNAHSHPNQPRAAAPLASFLPRSRTLLPFRTSPGRHPLPLLSRQFRSPHLRSPLRFLTYARLLRFLTYARPLRFPGYVRTLRFARVFRPLRVLFLEPALPPRPLPRTPSHPNFHPPSAVRLQAQEPSAKPPRALTQRCPQYPNDLRIPRPRLPEDRY